MPDDLKSCTDSLDTMKTALSQMLQTTQKLIASTRHSIKMLEKGEKREKREKREREKPIQHTTQLNVQKTIPQTPPLTHPPTNVPQRPVVQGTRGKWRGGSIFD